MDEEDKWRQYVIEEASKYGLEAECLEAYERYVDSGDDPAEAAWCALYDWDI